MFQFQRCKLQGIATLALAMLTAGCSGGSGPSGLAQDGRPAPDFTLPYSSGGDSLTLSKLRGKPVYLNFFASWCGPCREEAPDVGRLYGKYRPAGLVVVGIDELESAAKANDYLKTFHLAYRAVVDSGQIHGSYAGFGLPVHVFIDKAGTIKLYRAGEMNGTEIESAIRSIL